VHLHTVGSVDDARAAEQAGVDVLVAQGVEAGGHVYGTQPLHRLLADIAAACELPVIAAGGIATADDVAAAVALGACGVWVGTRFVAAAESRAHPAYRQAIIDGGPDATVWTADCFDSSWKAAPHRVLRNRTVEGYLRDGVRAGRDPIAATPRGAPIPRYDDRPPLDGMTGEVREMAMYAGCGVERIARIEPAADIVADLARGL
jgi:NAD(P)H-dependent flavin oxidoreductase YrpB (nitropropane dioxygenase family)